MIFHENRLLADDSHEISYLIFFQKIRKNVAKFVVCCSCDWHFKGYFKSLDSSTPVCQLMSLAGNLNKLQLDPDQDPLNVKSFTFVT